MEQNYLTKESEHMQLKQRPKKNYVPYIQSCYGVQ